MPITQSELAELKAKHGEVLHLETKWGHDIVFRVATMEEYNRFLEEHVDPQTRVSATRTLIYTCAVYPEREEFDKVIRARPGLLNKLADELTTFCGADRDALRKKS